MKSLVRDSAKILRRQSAILLTSAVVLGASAAHAGTISYTCAAGAAVALGDANFCTQLNTTIAGLYSSTFADANASIYIQTGTTGLGGSSQYLEATTYSTYKALLGLKALPANGGDARDASAVASLPVTEPATFGSDNIILTGALGATLGFVGNVGITTGGASCTIGAAGCYNGIITLATPASLTANYGQTYYYRTGSQAANAYDIFTVTEHETDEILGTLSCGGVTSTGVVDRCGSYAAATDLFRYTAPGSLAGYTSTAAYFSSDGGVTSVAPYNSTAVGADYGDFSTNCTHVQDAFGCPGGNSVDITNDNGDPEIAILDSIGYNLNPPAAVTPEPASLALLGTGLTGLVAAYRRRRSQ